MVAQRRRDPGDDVLSGLLAASHEGLTLTDAEAFSHVRLLYAIGATTTSDQMGNLLSALLTHPEILDRARLEPEVRPRVVLESLRWEPPVALLPRHAPLAGRIAGMDIPAASTLLVGIAAANRDPQKFMNADGFDPDRGESEILTFGLGRKFCPGVHLARTQLLTALDVLLERLPGLRLVDRAGSAPSGATLRAPEALGSNGRIEKHVSYWMFRLLLSEEELRQGVIFLLEAAHQLDEPAGAAPAAAARKLGAKLRGADGGVDRERL